MFKLVEIMMFLVFPLAFSTGLDNRYWAVHLSNVTHTKVKGAYKALIYIPEIKRSQVGKRLSS